ncbi:MAG TPA: hypothetical protein VHF22_12155, partial [Planctomycetota bacterium]|nr:hypothetical protein [Planctomycetota bacterium]
MSGGVGGVGSDFNPVERPASGGYPAAPQPQEGAVVRGGPGPRSIDLFPRDVLWNVATGGVPGAAGPAAPARSPAFDFSPADPRTAEKNRQQYL